MSYSFRLPAHASRFFNRLPNVAPLCRFCAHPMAPESLGWRERVMWCPQCRRVVEKSLFKAPGWIVGLVVVLSIKILCGL
jgi:hypothetical protein